MSDHDRLERAACSKAQAAADYQRSLALAEPTTVAA
jgi:hypothetical protein